MLCERRYAIEAPSVIEAPDEIRTRIDSHAALTFLCRTPRDRKKIVRCAVKSRTNEQRGFLRIRS